MKTLNENDVALLRGALDTLGVELTNHGHTWTEGERAIYEQGIAILERDSPAEFDFKRVSRVVDNCRRQIVRLQMKLPLNLALSVGRADEALAEAQSWLRVRADEKDGGAS